MTMKSDKHETVAKPGKAVPDAIGTRVEGDKPASDGPATPTTAGSQHPPAKGTKTSGNPKVPGKSVPDAIRDTDTST